MMYEPDFLELLINNGLIDVYYSDAELQKELYLCKCAEDFNNFSEYFVMKHNAEISQKIALNDFLDKCYNLADKGDSNTWTMQMMLT